MDAGAAESFEVCTQFQGMLSMMIPSTLRDASACMIYCYNPEIQMCSTANHDRHIPSMSTSTKDLGSLSAAQALLISHLHAHVEHARELELRFWKQADCMSCSTICTILYHTMPFYAILCHTMPYCAILYYAVPYDTIQYHRIPYDTV